jgi:integrase
MGKPGTLSRNSLKHIKTFMSAFFKLAKQQGYYSGENPVRDTAISPRAAEPQETYAYDLDEIQSILALLPETAATVFAVAAFAGLRRSELQGLVWENYQDGVIRVTRAVWEGQINEPKTKRSRGAVPVIKPLAARLDLYRLRCGNPQSGPMFANQSGKPMSLNNLLHREILIAKLRSRVWASRFYLKYQGKHRGWVERREFTGAGGTSVLGLTVEQLDAMEGRRAETQGCNRKDIIGKSLAAEKKLPSLTQTGQISAERLRPLPNA